MWINGSRGELDCDQSVNPTWTGIVPRKKSCPACVVGATALQGGLSLPGLDSLSRNGHHKRFESRRLIVVAELGEDWVAIVLSGVVKLTRSLPDGRQQTVALLFASDFLGRPFKAGKAYAAESATVVELCCFSRRQFEELLHRQADLKQLFLERTLDQLDAAHECMLLLGRKTAQEKVATLILQILRRFQATEGTRGVLPSGTKFKLPLSRAEMADYLGLRIETVSRQFQVLRTAGVLDTARDRTVTVKDTRALELHSGE